ncbi:hypothetical protein [uncultured Oscillibacter sp.]|uniref:hypothetical protein n=1 Tax=uncultured Oscillibacter sp. TaxID=876091 RepID=UPI00263A0BBE|nr:hypothetical protein [uncultured Oscillibacter sp.]
MLEFIWCIFRISCILTVLFAFVMGLSIPFDGGSGILHFLDKLEERREQKRDWKQ